MERLTTLYYRIYARYDAAAIANSFLGRGLLTLVGTSGDMLYKIGAIDEKPWFVRSSMRGAKVKLREASKRRSGAFPNPTDVRRIDELRIACVADDFTVLSLSPECSVFSLRADTWQREIEGFQPHLLFIESAWAGNGGTWKWKVSVMSAELIELVLWCKRRSIPVVFWNKEDPSHYSTFLRAAKLCDLIFTTDIDCISDYRRDCENERVFFLPFAAQPSRHNPIETFSRLDAFCFAGSNYSKQEERIKTFSQFTTALTQLGEFAIYDRYLRTNDERMSFPRRYHRWIVGSLNAKEMEIAYKGYMYGVNMNTVKQSQTMFARRVMELIASNTVCISNYSLGMRNMLGDLAICTDDAVWLTRRVKEIRADADARDRLRLAGLTKVMEQHTYRHRLEYVFEKTFEVPLPKRKTRIAIISDPWSEHESERVRRCFVSQRHESKLLYLFSRGGQGIEDATGRQMDLRELTSREDIDLIAYFHPADHYGPDYLRHIADALIWTDKAAIGKASFFNESLRKVVEPGMEYKQVKSIAWRRGAIRKESVRSEMLMASLREENLPSDECMSIDRFDYCQNAIGTEAARVDGEMDIDDGLDICRILEVAEGSKGGGRLFRAESILLCERLPKTGDKDYRVLVDRLEMCRKKGPRMAAIGVCRTRRSQFFMIQGMDAMLLSSDEARKLLQEHSVPVFTLGLTQTIWGLLKDIGDDRRITIIRMPSAEDHDSKETGEGKERVSVGLAEELTAKAWSEVMRDPRFKVIDLNELCA